MEGSYYCRDFIEQQHGRIRRPRLQKAKYVGGTMPLRDEVEGALSASDRSHLYFYVEKGADYKLRYDSITTLSYGQHAGRRIGATIALGVTTLGIGALPVLFSKKRRHYLTIQFKDAESKEGGAAIFELGKDVIRTMLATLAGRTGKVIEFEDDEARKSGNK